MIIKTAQKLSRKLFEMLRNQYEKGTKERKKEANEQSNHISTATIYRFLCVCVCVYVWSLQPKASVTSTSCGKINTVACFEK